MTAVKLHLFCKVLRAQTKSFSLRYAIKNAVSFACTVADLVSKSLFYSDENEQTLLSIVGVFNMLGTFESKF
jgi:hypothetical protein